MINLYAIIAVNSVTIPDNLGVVPIEAQLLNSTNQLLQSKEVADPTITLATSVAFYDVPDGVYRVQVLRRTAMGALLGPAVFSNPVIVIGGQIVPSFDKAESASKQVAVPVNCVLAALPL